MNSSYFHPTASIEEGSIIGEGVKIWHNVHVRSGAILEDLVSLGKDVFIDQGVKVGKGSRVQNGVSIYRGVNIAEWCFVGPHVVFTNDIYPRAGNIKWDLVETNIGVGSSIGAGSILRCGVTIGEFAMIGAGSLITKDVPPYTLCLGSPAIDKKRICACGRTQYDLSKIGFNKINTCCYDNLNNSILELAKAL